MERSPAAAFDLGRLAPKLHHPATFLERGVALPLTTPLLAGARARPADNQRLELIILNPSGGRGVYIMPWAGITSFCRPTMHDSLLNQRIMALQHVTPTIIRRAARLVAAEGLAGEDAAEAARVATEADKADLILANYQLLIQLYEQPKPALGLASQLAPGGNKAAQLRAAVEWAAKEVGHSADWVAAALEQLAGVIAGLGVSDSGAKPRIQHQIDTLAQTRAEINRWAQSRHDDAMTSYAATFHSVSGLTLSLAETAVAEARRLTANMTGLLHRWGSNPDSVRELAGRPEWLLDGWEPICALWKAARDGTTQELALAEIAGLVPVMPKEVATWGGDGTQLIDRDLSRFRRIVAFNTDWSTGESVFDAVARYEQLRAATC